MTVAATAPVTWRLELVDDYVAHLVFEGQTPKAGPYGRRWVWAICAAQASAEPGLPEWYGRCAMCLLWLRRAGES